MPVIWAAGIGAATSLIGGIFGSAQASSQNRQAADNAAKQQQHLNYIAEKTNEYNDRLDAADKENYENQYTYEWDSAIQSWQRGNEIQDFRYLQDLRAYRRSLQITEQQLDFNNLAADQAYKAEDAALAGLFKQQMFDRESQIAGLKKTLLEGQLNRKANQAEFDAVVNKDMLGQLSIQQSLKQLSAETSFKKENALVESLQKQGVSELRQAGQSRVRGQAMTMGEFYRGMSQLSNSLMGSQRQAAMQLMELGADTSLSKKRLGIEMEKNDLAMATAQQDTEFNLRVLDANIAGAIAQSEVNRSQIALNKYGADLNAAAQTMIRPQRLSYEPRPIQPPKRIFVERMEVIPGMAAAPAQQSVWGPIVSGAFGAANAIAGGIAQQHILNKTGRSLDTLTQTMTNVGNNLSNNPLGPRK